MTEAQRGRIVVALTEKKVVPPKCIMCQHVAWTLADGFIFISLSDNPRNPTLGGRGLPCVALICDYCGHTLLVNMLRLGLQDMLQEEIGQPKSEQPKT